MELCHGMMGQTLTSDIQQEMNPWTDQNFGVYTVTNEATSGATLAKTTCVGDARDHVRHVTARYVKSLDADKITTQNDHRDVNGETKTHQLHRWTTKQLRMAMSSTLRKCVDYLTAQT